MGGKEDDTGRRPFEVRHEDRDYSGMTVEGTIATDASLGRSFFNGTDLANCSFERCDLANSEWSESKVARSAFAGCGLSGCDFVGASFEGTDFSDCDFSRGEWRDSRFDGCGFARCDFDHDTMSLCTFSRCRFDEATSVSLEQRSISMNVFSRCEFETTFASDAFVSRNFGVPATKDVGALLHPGGAATLDQACRLNNMGRMRVVDFVSAVEVLCNGLATGRPERRSSVPFVAAVLRALEAERRISATSLLYLERVFGDLVSSAREQRLFLAAMSVIVDIRAALFSMAGAATRLPEADVRAPGLLRVVFAETFDGQHVEILREALELAAEAPRESISVRSVAYGSTIIELLTSEAVSVAALLGALNLVLNQAKVVVENYSKLLKAAQMSGKPVAAHRRTRVARATAADILKPGAVTPALAPLRTAVDRHGRRLVELDERATVRLSAEKVD